MQQVQLSEAEQRVYQAVTTLEARGQVPYPDLIAEASGLTEEQVGSPCICSPRRVCCTARIRRWPASTSAPGSAPARWRDPRNHPRRFTPATRVATSNA